MNLRSDKRGLSTIVATLIIILLVLVSVAVIWIVVKELILNNSEKVSLGSITLNLDIKKAKIECDQVYVTVKRNVGEGDFIGLQFIIEGKETSDVFIEKVSMSELEVKIFNFILENLTYNEIKKIKVSPIFITESGKEFVGDVKDEYLISSSEIAEAGICIHEIIPQLLHIEYGLLYNWYAVNDSRGLCPEGWHVPSSTELYDTLASFAGGYLIAGGKLKETGFVHWEYPGNTAATDEFGFSALGGGIRYLGGTFMGMKQLIRLHGADETTENYNIQTQINYNEPLYRLIGEGSNNKEYGASVRCIRDNSIGWEEEDLMTDYDGNVYETVKIGTQIWSKQNLAVTHYRNGERIPEVINNGEWASLTTGALCAYNNDWSYVYHCYGEECKLPPIALEATGITRNSFVANWEFVDSATGYSLDVATDNTFNNLIINNLDVGNVHFYNITGLNNYEIAYYYRVRAYNEDNISNNSNIISVSVYPKYGLLYNWYAVNDSRDIANVGWHVPTSSEFYGLVISIGGNSNGAKLKVAGIEFWNSPNAGATNEFHFNAVGGGKIDPYYSQFMYFKTQSIYLSKNMNTGYFSGLRLYNDMEMSSINSFGINGGYSIRLVKDSTDCSTWGEEGTYVGNDGRIYRTICMGSQEWLADNLAETKYRNGDSISEVTNTTTWTSLTTGALCAYNNDWNYV
jgi:uncharacterized protein (TIGR02145 family)